ncbi:class I adenylate-forming enzyme family protein [Pseudofrankia inefficax]|uniref:AMP-dependent synthetase and ligase n=1 Tax=Pseudofrankia inefficax (strain DSM 45817 / CECT 9037 / DDB 130130 / EuI1c) TaxID=298654 RepID=E3IW26_PSEI1|nr:AMP-binding protein [Pseudofrankia inefficax]ADP84954.1 AMP-dependent synthetase and ligase [Pseudofrankia inefficax]
MSAGARVAARAGEPLLDRTIGDQLRAQAAARPDRPALRWAVDDDPAALQTLTYRELLLAAEAAAADIASRARPGQRVAVWAANGPEWVIVEYASALAGTILTPFNTAWTDDEVAHALALVSPRLLFAGSDSRGVDLRARAAGLVSRTPRCDPVDLDTVATRPRPVVWEPPDVRPYDPFLIQFTSGTTGRPKGATLSHRAALNAGQVRALTFHADEHDVWLNPVPLHHVGGSVVVVLAALASGASYVTMSRFHPADQVALMRATGATRTGGVPTMFRALLDIPGFDEALASVRSVGLGGTSVPPSLVERLQAHGATVSVAYAQSECPMITQSDPAGDAVHVATTVGRAAPFTELRVVGAAGDTAARGEVGEVLVRSPLTMIGYWDMPAATDEVLDAEGFLHTGDLGSLDEHGVVRIHGRAREVVIRGGENVYPIEVEDVLLRHPAVAAVAVLAAPSDHWGEEVAAVVRLATPTSATADDLAGFAAKSLAHFKIPSQWRFVEDFPMTAAGKIRKAELLALFSPDS